MHDLLFCCVCIPARRRLFNLISENETSVDLDESYIENFTFKNGFSRTIQQKILIELKLRRYFYSIFTLYLLAC
jgi:hypothetical protein